jgi:hypothetical protein
MSCLYEKENSRGSETYKAMELMKHVELNKILVDSVCNSSRLIREQARLASRDGEQPD